MKIMDRQHDYCGPPYPVLELVNSQALGKSSHPLKITQRIGKALHVPWRHTRATVGDKKWRR
jgi:hypothetical protein